MTNPNDGGPAFPRSASSDEGAELHNIAFAQAGMSLRDWFAGQALQGMLARLTSFNPAPGYPEHWHAAISQEAYEIADAMIAKRNKEKPHE